ncbi:uncharacterized protein LOC126784596 [Argentina anserina]|uniref:uncharacterized protein LOC126784596 n=1 Tax=Argentina anserina TaxID=57926 RepID=UPI0021762EED|nr:uncharacterized protein LOC126784596 [Potentilla anserina]
MCQIRAGNVVITAVYMVWIVICGSSLSYGDLVDQKVLNVGEELRRESMPLRMGSRLYRLQGIRPSTWYEVKISYPASIPASFSIQLKRGDSELPLNGNNRRLLNTEKLIFINNWNDEGGMYVLVTVEPEGVVAIPDAQEREDIIFNIVCDELLLGIPHQAWWVVGFVVVCLVLAFIIPSFLPPFLLRAVDQNASKDS